MAALTSRPSACETASTDAALLDRRRRGRLAFESPALLGGAAARMGLSCASCHLNGRGNPDFFVEGVSDQPGRADVTSGIFSKVRGDQMFNPVVIPDIALRDGKQIKDRTGPEFRKKVHGLVVEEFDGQEPSPEIFDALVAYMDGLAPAACPAGNGRLPLTAEDDLGAVRDAWTVAVSARPDVALFYLRAARLRLERIHERFVGPDQKEVRDALLGLSRAMEAEASVVRTGGKGASLDPEMERVAALVRMHGERSLYEPRLLRAALAD